MTYCRAWKKVEKIYMVVDSAISKINEEDFSPESTFDDAKSDSLLREIIPGYNRSEIPDIYLLSNMNRLTDMYSCAGMKYAIIDQVIALIMNLEPEEFWRLESEAYDI